MADDLICYCKQVSKSEIKKAIDEGADSLKEIQKITGACTGNMCKELNPKGVCCSKDILSLLNKPDSCSCCNHK